MKEPVELRIRKFMSKLPKMGAAMPEESPMLSRNQLVKLSFFGTNVALALWQLLGSYSAWGLVRTVAAIGVVAYVMFKDRNDAKPAVVSLAMLFVMQCATYLLVHFDQITASYSERGLPKVMGLIFQGQRTDISFVLLTGIVLFGLGMMKKMPPWVMSVGCGLICLAMSLFRWTKGELVNLKFSKGGWAFVAVSLFLAVMWTVVVFVVCKVSPESRKTCQRAGVGLLAVFLLLNVCYFLYLKSVASGLNKFLLALPTKEFVWWRVVLTCVLLVGLGMVAHDEEGASGVGWPDEHFLYMCATLVFGMRVLMSNYFTHSWLLYLTLCVAVLYGFDKAYDLKRPFGLGSRVFYLASSAAFTCLALLLCWGLRANAVVTVASYLLLRHLHGKEDVSVDVWWLAIVTCLIAEGFARMAAWRESIEGCIIFGVMLAMSVAVIKTLGANQPGGKEVGSSYYAFVAICIAVLCLFSLRSPIYVDAVTKGDKVIVASEALGEGNKFKRTRYVWKDASGKKITKAAKLKERSLTIPIKGEILTIVVTDSNGIRCTREFFYAPWVHKFE